MHAQSCETLSKTMDCSPADSSVHGVLQAVILEWVAMLSSRGSSDHGIKPMPLASNCIGRGILHHFHSLG